MGYANYAGILDYLYQTHWLSEGYSSPVTSSHWKNLGMKCEVLKSGGEYKLSGVGFGGFYSRSLIHKIKCFPEMIFNQKLLKKYSVNETICNGGKEVCIKEGRLLNFDCVKQIIAADFLSQKGILNGLKTAVVIGDGYGFMTSLLKKIEPRLIVYSVNLGKILFFDVFYTQKVHPGEKIILAKVKEDLVQTRGNGIIFLEAEQSDILFEQPLDLFISITSMQEMDTPIIGNYFKIMRSGKGARYFYCCNRVEKILPDNSIIRFNDYPWDNQNDKIIVDELCPWYKKYPYNKPPFWKYINGPIQHRLAKLSKQG